MRCSKCGSCVYRLPSWRLFASAERTAGRRTWILKRIDRSFPGRWSWSSFVCQGVQWVRYKATGQHMPMLYARRSLYHNFRRDEGGIESS